MKKNIFETVEMNFQSFADVIATSGAYDGLNGRMTRKAIG